MKKGKSKAKTVLEFSDGEVIEIGMSIRDLAIEQITGNLRGMGIPEADIAKAVAESKRINSDKPLSALAMKFLGVK